MNVASSGVETVSSVFSVAALVISSVGAVVTVLARRLGGRAGNSLAQRWFRTVLKFKVERDRHTPGSPD